MVALNSLIVRDQRITLTSGPFDVMYGNFQGTFQFPFTGLFSEILGLEGSDWLPRDSPSLPNPGNRNFQGAFSFPFPGLFSDCQGRPGFQGSRAVGGRELKPRLVARVETPTSR